MNRSSVLQAAAHHARKPSARFDLADECRAAGIDPVTAEALVDGAGLSAGGRITAPGLSGLGSAIWADMAGMLRPIEAADAQAGEHAGADLSAKAPRALATTLPSISSPAAVLLQATTAAMAFSKRLARPSFF